MNRNQIRVLWCGIAVMALMLLVPPWKYTFHVPHKMKMEHHGPYRILLAPPKVPVTSTSEHSSWQGFHGRDVDMWTARVDTMRLGLQVAIAALLTMGLMVSLKDRRSEQGGS